MYVINFFYIGNNYSHTHTLIIPFIFRHAYDLEINNSRQGHHFYDITIEYVLCLFIANFLHEFFLFVIKH